MRTFLTLLITMIFIIVAYVGLSEITVTYKSGDSNVDINGSGNWQETTVNMNLQENSIIKTEKEAILEINIDGQQISVGEKTTVKISEILSNLTEIKDIGWLSNLQSVFSTKIKEGEDQTKTTLAGVRGDITEDEEIAWVDDLGDFEEEESPETIFAEAKALYRDGKYSQAFNILNELITDERLSYLKEEIAFYLGSTMCNNLQYTESLPYLEMSINESEAYYYENALMYLSFARFFSKDYSGAIVSFNSYVEQFDKGDFIPYAKLMLGKSYKELGQINKARDYFNEIELRYSDSEVYIDAVNEMSKL
jgi:TolA-binding protein